MTQELIDLILQHRNASQDYISIKVMNIGTVKDLDLYEIAQYRGQVYAMDAILDIQQFFKERLEEPRDEEIQGPGSKFDY
jgi:hypothetical protein